MRRTLLLLSLVALASASFQAATVSFWQVTTRAEFLKGEGEAIAIDTDGRVTLGLALVPVGDPESPALWRALAHAGQVYVGSGSDGKVFRIGANGTLEAFFDSDQLQVHALAAGPGRDIYVATSPEGKVYRVDPDGKGTVVFDPEEKYVWALAAAADGALLVATGEPGGLYRVGVDGQSTRIYRASATHVTTVAVQRTGTIVIGTDSPGQVPGSTRRAGHSSCSTRRCARSGPSSCRRTATSSWPP